MGRVGGCLNKTSELEGATRKGFFFLPAYRRRLFLGLFIFIFRIFGKLDERCLTGIAVRDHRGTITLIRFSFRNVAVESIFTNRFDLLLIVGIFYDALHGFNRKWQRIVHDVTVVPVASRRLLGPSSGRTMCVPVSAP